MTEHKTVVEVALHFCYHVFLRLKPDCKVGYSLYNFMIQLPFTKSFKKRYRRRYKYRNIAYLMLFVLFKLNAGALSYTLRSSGFFLRSDWCSQNIETEPSPVTSSRNLVDSALRVISPKGCFLYPMCHNHISRKQLNLFIRGKADINN